jgi:oligoendopeptidase F
MTVRAVRSRDEVDPRYTWNAESVFESQVSWEKEVKDILASLGNVENFQGRLGEGPDVLVEAFELVQDILQRVRKVLMFATVLHEVDTGEQEPTKMFGQARSLVGAAGAATAFFEPEILEIGQPQIENWLEQDPRLEAYRQFFHNLFRKQAHVRSPEVEEVLGLLLDPFTGPEAVHSVLTDNDFKFRPAQSSQGETVEFTAGSFEEILAGGDREARRTAWESYTDTFLDYKNTLAGLLSTSIKQNVVLSRARRHSSTLEASLFKNNIPLEVFHTLIEVFRKNLPTWHRYWAVRRKALGTEDLHPYDIWAPLAKTRLTVPYEQAVDWVCEGLAPMGEEYVGVIRRGCLQDRWIDVYPNIGKFSGAFSYGSPGSYPFILMNYDDTLFSLSTLAHELGHSMHSYLTWQTQPVIYGEYSLFVAEVASNFHQAMVRAHLFETQSDQDFQITLIEEAMSNFHRYFFVMPTLARFELEMHQKVERGEGLSADDMIARMADLFLEGYGEEMQVDRPRIGITWATFGHLYNHYYVYQYATGIAGANALANRILSGEEGAVEDYLNFLRAGSSMYPLEALKIAGVDLTRPEPVEEAFRTLADYVDKLEKLVEVGKDR